MDAKDAFNLAVNLAWGDVAVDNNENPQMIRIHLKKSKCDQFGAGSDITVGCTGSSLCPFAAILSFITFCGDSPGLFFIDSDKTAFTKSQFVSEIHSILNMVGLPQHHYAGHSFRIGAATLAALAGVQDSTIQALGRWHSAAFLQYIRMPREQLASLSSVLASSGTQLPQSVGSRPSQPTGCCLAVPGPIATHLAG